MSKIVKNIKSMWNVCGKTAERCAKAAKRECKEFEKGWAEAETYQIQHPDAWNELHSYYFNC